MKSTTIVLIVLNLLMVLSGFVTSPDNHQSQFNHTKLSLIASKSSSSCQNPSLQLNYTLNKCMYNSTLYYQDFIDIQINKTSHGDMILRQWFDSNDGSCGRPAQNEWVPVGKCFGENHMGWFVEITVVPEREDTC